MRHATSWYRIMDLNFKCREICASKAQKYKNDRPEHAELYRQLYKKTLLMAAPVDFDSYCQYLEWNRAANKRFYLPRRKQLKVVAEALQEYRSSLLEKRLNGESPDEEDD